jgi:oxygen-independent coproporphyrinogen-3 oxidase
MNNEEHPGLYLHIPFCRSKCRYCDFYSVASHSEIPAWLQAVQRERLLYREKFREFDSLYLGGGTPTILGKRELAALMECLRKHFAFCPESEITIEAREVLSGEQFDLEALALGLRTSDGIGLRASGGA